MLENNAKDDIIALALFKIGENVMKIRALLIGSSGEGDSYLLGVKKDVRAMKNYLLSGNGGAWESHEINILYEPSLLTLNTTLSIIEQENNDFVFVCFFGHGNYDTHYGRKFYLNSKDFFSLSDIRNLAKKQIFIADSCAEITSVELSESLESKGFDSSSYRHLKRAKYINWLSNCNNQKINLFGCSVDECSGESDKGGYFTQALINVGNNSLQELSVLEAFELAKMKVQRSTFYEQNPAYELSNRSGRILPFKV